MIIILNNDVNKSNTFGYEEKPTKVFVNLYIKDYKGVDFWHDYCLSDFYGKESFEEYLRSLGFIETTNFWEAVY